MPPSAVPAPVGRRPTSRNKVLLIILIVCGLLAASGAATAFVLYDRATEIDRSTPTVSVRQFLNAVFVERDDERVKLFVCSQWTRERTAAIQRSFDPEVRVTWRSLVEQSRQEDQAVVTAQMRLVFQGLVNLQDWRFDTVRDDGWRVCAAGPA